MGFLTPLYILGALAVAGPILFHLIRRAPHGQVRFSSLMFLSPTPPRVAKRSRLENWPLLLLRALALILLALAFGRPFMRRAVRLGAAEVPRQRIVVLIDTSASMRRGDLWERARARAAEAINACRPGDLLALHAFDSGSHRLIGFEESARLDPSRRRALALGRLETLSPTWGATDLGLALIDAVAAIEDVGDDSDEAGRMPRRIVLVSDLQRGARLDALGPFEWPSTVRLDLATVEDSGGNAGVQRLEDPRIARVGDDPDGLLRVRVSNESTSTLERFSLRWDHDDARPVDAYVPPGESRVVRLERPDADATGAVRLVGDSRPFDDAIYVADAEEDEATVLYLGNDAADDPEGLLYYLDRVFLDHPRRDVRVRRVDPAEPLKIEGDESVPLAVIAREPIPDTADQIAELVRGGGTALYVLNDPGPATSLESLMGIDLGDLPEANVDGDAMLGSIDFGHRLFAPLSGPQFNDFTKIRFWHYRRLNDDSLGNAEVVARFEGGAPAVVEQPLGKGRVVLFASSWRPVDSQLARSSKFVPLMISLLEGGSADDPDAADLHVGDPIILPARFRGSTVDVRTPVGSSVALAPDTETFTATVEPGVYRLESTKHRQGFAVNLDPAESRTDPLEVEALEQLGCRIAGRDEAEAPGPERRRQLLNAELEGRQKLWRWLILLVIVTLIVETWLAGRRTRPRSAVEEALAS